MTDNNIILNNTANNFQKNIQVSVRFRPLNEREINNGSINSWIIDENTIEFENSSSSNCRNIVYTFDHIFGPECRENRDIYESVIKELTHSCLRGVNSTVFAYGQTSAGKTFTMLGSDENPGIIPLAIRELFYKAEADSEREYSFRVSYLEIYNETISDLISPQNNNLKIHESLTRGVFVGNLVEEPVFNLEQTLEIVKNGEKIRHFGETNMNERSSRSHALFRVTIESQRNSDYEKERGNNRESTGGPILSSTFTFVDLAGSEKVKLTGAEGQRLKEGGHINKSLLALTTVISKLADGGDRSHIPFRDSKLTRILQSSLCGNVNTAIICNATLASEFIDETLCTLKFAARAKLIKTKPRVNEIISDREMIKRFQEEIIRLQQQIAQLSTSPTTDREENFSKRLKVTHHEKEKTVDVLNLNKITRLLLRDFSMVRQNLSRLIESANLQHSNTLLTFSSFIKKLRHQFLKNSEFSKYLSANLAMVYEGRLTEIRASADLTIQKLNDDLENHQKEIIALTEERGRLNNELGILRDRRVVKNFGAYEEIAKETGELSQKINHLEPILANLFNQAEEAKLLKLEIGKIKVLQDEIANRNSEIGILLERVKSLQGELKVSLEENDNINKIKNEMEQQYTLEIESSNVKVSNLKNLNASLMEEFEKLKAKFESLENEAQNHKQMMMEKNGLINELSDQLTLAKQTLKSKAEEDEIQTRDHHTYTDGLLNEINNMKNVVQDIAVENTNLITKLNSTETELNALRASSHVLQDKVKSLEDELLASKKEAQSKENYETMISELKVEIDSLQKSSMGEQSKMEIVLRIELEKLKVSHARERRLLQLRIDGLEDELRNSRLKNT